MKANDKAGRGLLRLLILLALLSAGISDVSRAAETASLPRSVVGTWKNSDRNMSMTFPEAGDFEFKQEKNGKNKMEKGLYKVTPSGDSLVVSVFFSRGKDYFSVTPLYENRAAWQELTSPADKPEPAKAVIWVRDQPAPQSAETRPPSGNAQGAELFALQEPENLIGRWENADPDGRVTTVSFSEKGEYEYAVEKDGKREVAEVTYTVLMRDGRLVVALTERDEKLYDGLVLTSKNRALSQQLKSPDDHIDPDKKVMILNRVQ